MTIQNLNEQQIAEVAGSATHAVFLKRFYATTEEFEVIASDSNGTGYYDGLVLRNLRKPIGTMLRAITPGENNRRMLVVVTPVGNLVIFERFTGGDKGVVVTNMPTMLRLILVSGTVSLEQLRYMIGDEFGGSNIGQALNYIGEGARDMNWEADRLIDPVTRH